MPLELNGDILAAKITSNVKSEIEGLTYGGFRRPYIALVMVGYERATAENAAAIQSTCDLSHVDCTLIHFQLGASSDLIATRIRKLNQDPTIDGIVLQLPLPESIDPNLVAEIAPAKDVAGLGPRSLFKPNDIDLNFIRALSRAAHGASLRHTLIIDNTPVYLTTAVTLLSRWPEMHIIQTTPNDFNLGDTRGADLVLVNRDIREQINWHGLNEHTLIFDMDMQSGAFAIAHESLTGDRVLPITGQHAPLATALLLRNALSASIASQWQVNQRFDKGIFPAFRGKRSYSASCLSQLTEQASDYERQRYLI